MMWWSVSAIVFTVIYKMYIPSSNSVLPIISGLLTYFVISGVPFIFILGYFRLVKKDKKELDKIVAISVLPAIVISSIFLFGLVNASRYH